MITVVRLFDFRSGSLAGNYLSQFRQVEGNAGGPILGERDFDLPWAAKSIDYNGPGRIVSLIKEGMNPAEAKRRVTGTLQGAVQKQVLQGGRRVVDLSALANPVSRGWRRVADASPCTFCALLVTRGPAYRSAKSAGEGREWHYKCGCTVEEVFSRWRPTRTEERYIDAYSDVAAQLRKERLDLTRGNVLSRLRKDGGFRDSPATPAAE